MSLEIPQLLDFASRHPILAILLPTVSFIAFVATWVSIDSSQSKSLAELHAKIETWANVPNREVRIAGEARSIRLESTDQEALTQVLLRRPKRYQPNHDRHVIEGQLELISEGEVPLLLGIYVRQREPHVVVLYGTNPSGRRTTACVVIEDATIVTMVLESGV
ncbi:MAG: hypothetical protein HON70_37660 [Lentisphaerae bacterium]|jgi:hypothetical protein|nr:hypothetical protein [Lentisphaerota bacterium]